MYELDEALDTNARLHEAEALCRRLLGVLAVPETIEPAAEAALFALQAVVACRRLAVADALCRFHTAGDRP